MDQNVSQSSLCEASGRDDVDTVRSFRVLVGCARVLEVPAVGTLLW
ncbi:permeases of the major facilitator [Zymobacter palmae]|uniref:Permeases of the major facilitator n=1 Tax=Zymobacter palmae TaxID=33074 RepID=A0A348HFM7_9GAMM|nr:permeases of the major facilitator [Zymobacter palmae]